MAVLQISYSPDISPDTIHETMFVGKDMQGVVAELWNPDRPFTPEEVAMLANANRVIELTEGEMLVLHLGRNKFVLIDLSTIKDKVAFARELCAHMTRHETLALAKRDWLGELKRDQRTVLAVLMYFDMMTVDDYRRYRSLIDGNKRWTIYEDYLQVWSVFVDIEDRKAFADRVNIID